MDEYRRVLRLKGKGVPAATAAKTTSSSRSR
jgi:hypothetical protein